MHTKLMYCFTCYIALYITHNYLKYSIEIATKQSFRFMELTNAKHEFPKCVIMLGFCELG